MISNAARKNAGAGLPTISAFTSQANCKIWFIKYCNNEEEKTGKSNIDESEINNNLLYGSKKA